MAAAARLIALILACCASSVFAIGTVPSTSGVLWQMGPSDTRCRNADGLAAGKCALATTNGVSESTLSNCTIQSQTGTTPGSIITPRCYYAPNSIYMSNATVVAVSGGVACPANAAFDSAGNCKCSLGYRTANPDGTGACVAYTCPSTVLPNDTNAGPYASKPELGADLYYCDTARNVYTGNATYGCSITAGPYYAGQGADGNWWVRYVNRFNVAPCMGDGNDVKPSQTPPIPAAPGTAASGVSADANGSTPPSSSPCAKGTCPGVFNGTSMCLACSSEVSTQNTTTTTPSGAASAPTGTQAGSTSTQVSCTGTTCTTTTTTYSSSGAVVGQTSTTGTKTAACTANPGSSLCSGSGSGGTGDSSFGGTCGAFTCSGDAVQCAIALDQHKRNCTLFDTATTLSTAGEAAVAAGTTAQVGAGSSTTALGTFDQTDIVSGTCPSSVSIGGLVTMNLTPLCSAAGWLGNLLVGLTALACLGIVFGVKGGT